MAGAIKLPRANGAEMVGENFGFSLGNWLAPLYHGRKGSQNKSEPFRPSIVWCSLGRYLELPGILSQKNKAGEGKLVLPISWGPDLVMAGPVTTSKSGSGFCPDLVQQFFLLAGLQLGLSNESNPSGAQVETGSGLRVGLMYNSQLFRNRTFLVCTFPGPTIVKGGSVQTSQTIYSKVCWNYNNQIILLIFLLGMHKNNNYKNYV